MKEQRSSSALPARCKSTRPSYGMSGGKSLVAPEMSQLKDDELDLNHYMLEPTNPVACLPGQDDPYYWFKRRGTMNFWAHSGCQDAFDSCIPLYAE